MTALIQVIDNARKVRTPAQRREMPLVYTTCGAPAVYVIVAVTKNIPACDMCLMAGIRNELSLIANGGHLIGVRYANTGETCEVRL